MNEKDEFTYQLSQTVFWLVEQWAKDNNCSLTQACQLLALRAPERYMVQMLNIAEKAFRERGL